jgi:hypothetical protein
MSCYPKPSVLAVAVSLPFFLFTSNAVAQIAPADESADSQSYDVTLRSRDGGEYSGSFTFNRDTEESQDVESSELTLSLTPVDGDSPTTTTGEGTGWSWEFSFFSFWFAHAETDSSGQMVAFGLQFGDHLFGKAGVFDDATIETGRYRIRGEGVETSDAVEEETSDAVEEETTTELETTE